MIVHKIKYNDTNHFSELVEDYSQELVNKELYNRFPSTDNFLEQINEKSKQDLDRELLVSVLKKQNEGINLSKKSLFNIDSLSKKNTYTVTTGHQLCLFTGPLYFLYKIISTINLAEKLSKEFNEYNFVPIFWMASEDHDFNEINNVTINGNKFLWESDQQGPVGKFNTKGIINIIENISSIIGNTENNSSIINLLKKCYSQNNFSEATRCLINEVFGKYGLVILDANDKNFKKKLLPIMKEDLVFQSLSPIIKNNTIQNSKKYKTQAYVRDFNFFKISNSSRERVLEVVSESELEDNPEKYSPNVLMRPLYQELILPNLCYIGGGAEISYWMQLKTVFKEQNIVFPILNLRNSVLWIEKRDYEKWKDLGFTLEDLFLSTEYLEKTYVQNYFDINLSKEKKSLKKIFNNIFDRIKDKALLPSIESSQITNIKSIENLEKKLIRFYKKKHEIELNHIRKIKSKLFQNNHLQERTDNIIPYYCKYGEKFIETLKKELDPLDLNFLILSPSKNKK